MSAEADTREGKQEKLNVPSGVVDASDMPKRKDWERTNGGG